MVEFIFTTQSNYSTRYNGPSGKSYSIVMKAPFTVTDPIDVAFFDSKSQFRRKGIFEKKPEPVKEEEETEEWFTEVADIWGISEKLANVIVDIYPTKDSLMKAIEDGGNLGHEIPKKKQEKLINFFIGD